MSREDRKLRKHFEERAKRELRLARKHRQNEPGTRSESYSTGMVIETGPGFADILGIGARVRCRSAGDAAIGDQVLFSIDRRRVEGVLPRRTALSRADPHNPHIERVIAANIDLVVNVVALKNPPLRPGLIDRYLIAIGASRAEPLLCVNKIDLLDGPADLEALRPYQDLGVTVVLCSAATQTGIDSLREALAGKLCVFTGHSGVGKSSLLNALATDLDLATREVSIGNARGRHTTTSSTLHELPNGARIIDTPGIREFGLWNITASEVRQYFAEFDRYRCVFANCSHTHEPSCAVKCAVESGAIATARWESYQRIIASV